MPPDRPLLMQVERYLRETGMPETSFGRMAVRDPRFVSDLRCGRSPGQRVCARVEQFMRNSKGARA
jgi:hypothetical protein